MKNVDLVAIGNCCAREWLQLRLTARVDSLYLKTLLAEKKNVNYPQSK